jgi:membrane protein implicated in regulation of membrane protease activity
MAVALFAAIVYLFISGAQRLGLPSTAMIAIFVIISGIFAWLVKRITDIVSGMSQRWFPEQEESD